MLTFLGQATFGQHAPLCAVMNAQLGQAIGAALSELEGSLAGLLNVSAAISIKPPAFEAQVEAITQVIANMRATGPSITLQGAAVLDLIAALRLQIRALQAMIQLPLGGSIYGYWYSGSAGAFGSELAASTAGGFPNGGRPTDHTGALILAAVEPATVLLLKSVFRTEI